MKYYAVKKGRGKTPAIYNTWEECKSKVQGYQGAEYKSFKTLEEANDYIKGNSKQESNSNKLVAYVDGSYSVSKDNYAYGVVLIKNGSIIKTMSDKGKDRGAAKMRQIYGELQGVIKALDYAIKKGEKEIHVYYDYYGIEHWATGKWNRNNPFTEHYHDYMQKRMKKIRIVFHKVAAHSGNKYNDMADKLAKDALL